MLVGLVLKPAPVEFRGLPYLLKFAAVEAGLVLVEVLIVEVYCPKTFTVVASKLTFLPYVLSIRVAYYPNLDGLAGWYLIFCHFDLLFALLGLVWGLNAPPLILV